MKRDEELKTLSWEHHDALVSASRLKRGVEKKAQISQMREFLLYVWENDLPHHFEQEEQSIIKAVQGKEGSQPLVERVLAEHKKFAALAEEINAEQGDMMAKIEEFAVLLNAHVRFEEREFFPFVEESLSKDELAEVGVFLREEHRPSCKTWNPEFWK